jgi:ubiquinone/menaquinone biosynthesis C-methylase UbiE
MSLLDCGCGARSITLDLAESVAPGRMIWLDLDENQ